MSREMPQLQKYCDIYDSFYNPKTKVWTEKDCGCKDKGCSCPFPPRPESHPDDCDCWSLALMIVREQE